MAIVIKSGNYATCPEGECNAVCVDVVDLGVQPSKFGPKPKISLTFQTDHLDERGLPFIIFASYNASLHKKAKLNELLRRWFKKDFEKGLAAAKKDLESLLGKGARLELVHVVKDDKTYVNLDTKESWGIRPLGADQKAPAPHPDFRRKKDRAEGEGPFGKRGEGHASDPDEHTGDQEEF